MKIREHINRSQRDLEDLNAKKETISNQLNRMKNEKHFITTRIEKLGASKDRRINNFLPQVVPIQRRIEEYAKAGKFKGVKPFGPIGTKSIIDFI